MVTSFSGNPVLIQQCRADINAVKNGSTPLILAARLGQDFAVELLLSQAEIQVNLRDRYGAAVWHAACQGHASTLQKLLEAPQIRVNDFDIKYGLTPLAVAVAKGYEATVKLLLGDHHVNVNSVDKTRRTPIFGAIARGHQGILKSLLSHQQTDVNFRDSKGRTPLLYAMYKKPSMASLLLYDPRILIDFQDYTGCTAVWIRVKKNKQQFVEHLLRRGADPNIADYTRLTPLSLASKSGSIDILQLLLANGAHLHSRDEQGKTPLHHAALFGRDKLF